MNNQKMGAFTSSDIDYIKNNLKYDISKPFFRKRIIVSLAVIFVTIFICVFSIIVEKTSRDIIRIVIFLPVVIISLVNFYRFLRSLNFAVIKTPLSKDQNTAIIADFLTKNNIGFDHTGEAIQIVSRKQYTDGNIREYIVIIPDDGQILLNTTIVNSVLINSGWRTPYPNNFQKIKMEISALVA